MNNNLFLYIILIIHKCYIIIYIIQYVLYVGNHAYIIPIFIPYILYIFYLAVITDCFPLNTG